MPELTASSMHDARDAEDSRLLAAGEHRKLVESYYGVIVKRCQARTRTDTDAYDVASAVVVRLLEELKRDKHYRVPFRVVVHKIVGWKLAEHFGERPNEAERDELATEDASLAAANEHDAVTGLLQGLPGREREVALLRLVGGLPPAQIAERLGTTRNNVDQAWHRAKRKLRERLAEA